MPKGIYNRTKSKPYPRRKFFHDKKWLVEEYLHKKRSTVDIGKEISCSCQVINHWCRKFGIKLRDSRSSEQLRRMLKKSVQLTTKYHITKDYLEKEYLTARKTINQIATEFGCSWEVIYKRIKKHNLPLRNRKMFYRGRRRRTTTEHKRFQKKILGVYGYKCAICGYNKFVNAHHIEPWAKNENNSLENGILLCPNHHAEADYGIITPEELKKYQVNKT